MTDEIALFTFDIFGTVLDWQRGMSASLKAIGVDLQGDDFDRVIDGQASLECGPYRTYRERRDGGP